MNLDKNNNPLPPTDFAQINSSQPNFAQNQPFPNQAVQTSQNHAMTANEQSLVSFNHITYALYALSFFTAGLTWIIPIVMNYMKRDEARGTWLYSHFDWQIKTFWYGIFFAVIAFVMIFFGFGGLFLGAMANSSGAMGGSVILGSIGVLLAIGVTLWHLYRIVRGWIALSNRRAIG